MSGKYRQLYENAWWGGCFLTILWGVNMAMLIGRCPILWDCAPFGACVLCYLLLRHECGKIPERWATPIEISPIEIT